MATDDNPYRAPAADVRARAVGVRSGLRSDLRDVAVAQKGVLICMLVQVMLLIVSFAAPADVKSIIPFVLIAVGLVGVVFVFMLTIKVYNVFLGILFCFAALMPCLGLLVLFMVNSRATSILQANGIHVGFMGADLSQLPRG